MLLVVFVLSLITDMHPFHFHSGLASSASFRPIKELHNQIDNDAEDYHFKLSGSEVAQ
jgi:hypothetical protein